VLIDFRTLFPKYNIKPKGVCHVGGNKGEEFPVYMELGIKRQLWFEPNPEYFIKLSKTIADNDEAIAMPYCLGEEDVDINFHISNNDGQSSSVLDLGTHLDVHPEVFFVKDIQVPMRRFDSIVTNGEQYDFLNIDTQGYELHVLKGMGELLNNFKWAYLEVNKAELYKKCPLVEEVDEYLSYFGFERTETLWCGNTNWGDALYIKNNFSDKDGNPIKMPYFDLTK